MKTIFEGDKFVSLILGKHSLDAEKKYRWSDYAIEHSCNGERFFYNNFTKVCYQLNGEALTVKKEQRFTADEISASKTLTQLFAARFLVREDLDEAAVYEGFCKIARAMRLKKEGITRYTILPTTACNARCVYCYEAGIKYVTMTDETVRQTVNFIEKSHNPKKPVHFGWFGGEPLMGEKIIDKICAAMREKGIEFKSSMISNGSLISDSVVKKMKENWNLKNIQITLDGTEEQYNTRKNYYFNYDSAYWHVLGNIKRVNANGIRLNIRVNVDNENIGNILTMMEDVKNFISDPSLVSFDLAPLFDLQASDNGWEIWDKTFQISEEIAKQGFKISPHYSVERTRYQFCMADSPYSSVVIAPDGKLYACEHVQSVDSLGDIWHGITNTELVKKMMATEPAQEKCKGCFALPHCTTFSQCPNLKGDCRYASRKRMERALEKMIRYFENQEHVEAEEPDDNEIDQDC